MDDIVLGLLANAGEKEMLIYLSIGAILFGGGLGCLPYIQLRKGYRTGVMESMNTVHRSTSRSGMPATWVNKGGSKNHEREKDPAAFRRAAIPYFVMLFIFWGPAVLGILLLFIFGFAWLVNNFII